MSDIYRLRIGIFVSGFCVMVLELLGTRILAPYLGTSLAVWTTLIGIAMACLSVGYYWGGILSEKNAKLSILSVMLLVPAAWICVVTITKELFMTYLVQQVTIRQLQIVISSIIFIGVPSVFLGTISPFAARLAISSIRKSGSAIGGMYAISTIGSILGTFLAGFLLIPRFGHLQSLYLMAIILTVASLILSNTYRWIKIPVLFLSILAICQKWVVMPAVGFRLVEDTDTSYVRVQVSETQTSAGVLSSMRLDSAFSSAVISHNPRLLVFGYYNFYDYMFWNKNVQHVLMIGGAGMGYPRYVSAVYPDISLTVVDIDPELYTIAKRSMGYVPSDSVAMVFEDGRAFLNTNTKKYDAILMDVFSSHTIPWHLVTKESVKRIKESVTDDGLVIVNVISAFEGDRSNIIRSIASTYASVFDVVELFAVQHMASPSAVQNIILVAANKKLDFNHNNLSSRSISLLSQRRRSLIGGMVLTDDLSPIDSYTESMLTK